MPIDWLVVGGALLSGLLGGAHCAAMCGGIATGLSVQQRGGWWVALQPNLGRIGGYVLAGAIVGGIGHGLLDVARVPQLAIALRAAVGVVLIVAALRLLDRRGRLSFLGGAGARAWQWLRPLQRRLLPANTATRRMALGLLWGWMPCGLSTTLLAAAWLQASALHGAMTMAAFGLGTLPVMLPLTWAGARMGQRLQRGGWRVAMGLCVLCSGVLTLAAPLLMQSPALHGVLAALGCRALPA
ncbi:sulfite exporter TauE/SafE family protein [Lysobacter solisilvae (ex Woo and Kim 2020)]|uniref:Sulfite exporter TauE/SafE family protein n=1 Tax=Agrilutibacter terrestris TaxID=2865112 RepID=A0A7H0FWJ5_9GAMM|nr:sulfite exporter TauE/SafE family protein [Lysobacter terrestris]QNP40411.1 sulfite exporter TauE/SafE family protein [Lysobacter terrestris]